MKTTFVRSNAIKSFFKGHNKRSSKEVISTLDNVVHRILIKTLNTTRNFKTVTEKELEVVCNSLLK